MKLIADAFRQSEILMAVPLPLRWRHVQQVSIRAGKISDRLARDEAHLLVMAAWLHDIGYAPEVIDSEFHPLDGARFLRRQGWCKPLCNLVAHHSCAATEARVLGLADELGEFSDERGVVRDVLWYLDMTTGPGGSPMTFDARMNDVRRRYGPNHYVSRALAEGMSERVAAVRRAEEWIESVGLRGQV